jgi:cyclic pyranopterin phosphate synthase
MAELTHFSAQGDTHMVDVSEKEVTSRLAVASGRVKMAAETFEILKNGDAKKGDVLGVARLAGIMAAKKTSDLIPLCHPLPLTKAGITFDLIEHSNEVEVTATVRTAGKTGVEMEALTAVSVTCLTIYDMLKAVDKGMIISNIHLKLKEGGKSGWYEAKA